MKIGLLTFHRSYNFGANLQALAIQSILRNKGTEPIFINYHEEEKAESYRTMVSSPQAQIHELFFNRYYSESPPLRNGKEIREFCFDTVDAVIVGSDAVFRLMPKYDPINLLKGLIGRNPLPATVDIPPYWLPWSSVWNGKKIIKASVAASSMGTMYQFMPSRLKDEIRRSIRQFDIITVRDRWTQEMIRFISRGEVVPQICPDPVFSLAANFSIPQDEYPNCDLSKTILLSGRFDPKWLRQFKERSHSCGYSLASLPNPDADFAGLCVDFSIPLPLSPLKWYLLLAGAAGYVGIRFHALVSCMANDTPAINVDPHPRSKLFKTGSKMYDLCLQAGISDRCYSLNLLNRTSPSLVLDRLFDAHTLAHGSIYAANAARQFDRLLGQIIVASSQYT